MRFARCIRCSLEPFLGLAFGIDCQPFLMDPILGDDETVLVTNPVENESHLEFTRLLGRFRIEHEGVDWDLVSFLPILRGSKHEVPKEGKGLNQVAFPRGIGAVDGGASEQGVAFEPLGRHRVSWKFLPGPRNHAEPFVSAIGSEVRKPEFEEHGVCPRQIGAFFCRSLSRTSSKLYSLSS